MENVAVSGFNFFAQHKSDSHEMQVGVDGQLNGLKSTANEVDIYTGASSNLDTRYPDGTNSMALAGVYLTHLWKLSEKTNMTDGLRVGYSSLKSTMVDTTFFKFPFNTIEQQTPTYSGSIGLVHNSSEKLKFSNEVKILENKVKDKESLNEKYKLIKHFFYIFSLNFFLLD